ncbi:signal peptidase I [Gulosibacter molinativorax]|uniref:signal peptidase I n=1 Tax=Gulosibacter molinativorax TaxID=256821 RepID=UPI0003F8EABE|nr:signal peptidase I [Gulosibacter molinativorax]
MATHSEQASQEEASAPPEPGGSSTPRRPSFIRRLFRNPLTPLLTALILVSLIQGFVVKLNEVHSTSMLDTLHPTERILVNRLSYLFASPQPGDVVTYTVPEDWNEPKPFEIDSPFEYAVRLFGEVTGIGPPLSVTNLKRIVATPGQVVQIAQDGSLLVDGERAPNSSTGINFEPGTAPANCSSDKAEPCFEFVVPEGEYVVAGDNRPNSSDSLSHCWGEAVDGCVRTVPEDAIIGNVFAVAFPNTRVVN